MQSCLKTLIKAEVLFNNIKDIVSKIYGSQQAMSKKQPNEAILFNDIEDIILGLQDMSKNQPNAEILFNDIEDIISRIHGSQQAMSKNQPNAEILFNDIKDIILGLQDMSKNQPNDNPLNRNEEQITENSTYSKNIMDAQSEIICLRNQLKKIHNAFINESKSKELLSDLKILIQIILIRSKSKKRHLKKDMLVKDLQVCIRMSPEIENFEFHGFIKHITIDNKIMVILNNGVEVESLESFMLEPCYPEIGEKGLIIHGNHSGVIVTIIGIKKLSVTVKTKFAELFELNRDFIWGMKNNEK